MAVSGGPNIVKDGLILALDAANLKSYQRTGATWVDLSNRGTNFTLSNETSFSTAYTGEIVVAPFNNGIVISNSSAITTNTTCSLQMWIRINNDTQGILFGGPNYNNTYYGAYQSNTGFYEGVFTQNSYRVNTRPFSGLVSASLVNNNYFLFEVRNMNLSGRTGPDNDWSSYTFVPFTNSAIGMILLYDRNLTPNESVQNFNATRGRFGV
jgi:hypothetical protein